MSTTAANYPPYPHFLITHPSSQPCTLHVEINRPQKLNAFSGPMFSELQDIFERVRLDSAIRVVILSGVGERAFTAGLDLQGALGISKSNLKEGEGQIGGDSYREARKVRETILQWQKAVNAVEGCGKRPQLFFNFLGLAVIAILHGVSYGLALDLTSACDIRICTRSTRFSLKEVDIGLAADLGTLTRLPKIVGSMSWVKEIAYTCREFGGEEALRMGFVSWCEEEKEDACKRALEVAGAVGGKSPVAVEGTKELLDWGVGRPVQDGLRYTQIWNAPAILAADVKEAVTATLQKRKPNFSKL
ncbi:enoyl-CoA hydratase/isomerase family protein [Terfezia claveryi]|nr:enoyl-CoA hydratase/isomerase family protein [Terfezia claveryi]